MAAAKPDGLGAIARDCFEIADGRRLARERFVPKDF